MSDLFYRGVNVAKIALTIGGKTFKTSDQVVTPDGDGMVISADPFTDKEILVRLASGEFKWFSFKAIDLKASEE